MIILAILIHGQHMFLCIHSLPSISMLLTVTQNTCRTKRRGFTLIELLLTIGIIAILASIVIVAINPTKQLGDARNAQRRSDISTILNAVYQYAIDHSGTLPTSIATTSQSICKTTSPNCAGGADLSELTSNGKYLTAIPYDPKTSTTDLTDYTILKLSSGRITVSAPGAENDTTLTVTR